MLGIREDDLKFAASNGFRNVIGVKTHKRGDRGDFDQLSLP